MKLDDSLKQVSEPFLKHLVGWVSRLNPQRRDLVDLETTTEGLHGIRDVEITLETLVEVIEGGSDLMHESVHSLALLNSDNDVRVRLLDSEIDLKKVELSRE